MKHQNLRVLEVIILWAVTVFLIPGAVMGDDQPKTNNDGHAGSLQQRIDFGNAHIMGQSIKSGAVYLMHRKKSEIDSMLKVRQDYRTEIKEEYGLKNTALDKGDKPTDTTK